MSKTLNISVTVSVNMTIVGIPSESPLPPTSLTLIPSDTSIFLMWSHSDECFENCTFMYEVTWQQSGDGSSLRNTTTTETSYTIEGLIPSTSYEIGVGDYCKEYQTFNSVFTFINVKTIGKLMQLHVRACICI